MTTAGGASAARDETRPALLAALGCYTAWGFLPLMFMGLSQLGSTALEILAHRALWAVLWAGLLVILARQGGQVLRVLRQPRTLALLAVSTVMIAINWGGYVWATTRGATLEAALAYYLNPLLVMAAGTVLFRERVDGFGKVAIGLAVFGVLLQALALGRPPWITLAIALSFSAYAVIRKGVRADAQTGLFVECLLLTLPGLGYVVWLQSTGAGNMTDSWSEGLFLAATGPVTVFPLALFAWATRRLNLSTMGFLQFLAPTLQFAIGLATGEEFTLMRGLSFACIWAGVAVFVLGAVRRHRKAAEAPLTAEAGA